MMISPSRAQLAQLRRDNGAQSKFLRPVPQDQWPEERPGFNANIANPRVAVWRSSRFLVQAFAAGDGVTRLSICRTEWDRRQGRFKENISWDDIQDIKREAGYGSACAVEVYPDDADMVNVANMRHIFVLPEPPPYAWRRP